MINVATIGGGIGGLAASVRLAAKGYRVTVYEMQPFGGGKIGQVSGCGFRFDSGPSLFTLPQMIDELYDLAGRADLLLPYRKLSTITKYFFPDGKVLNAYANPADFADEVQRVLGEPAGNVRSYLQHCEELYKLVANIFIFNSFPLLSGFLTRESFKLILNPGQLRAFETMHHLNSRAFEQPNTIQLFDRYATYNGSNPYKAPGTLTIIPHLEHNIGAFFPEKGMRSVANGLIDLARSAGVEFHFNAGVSEILVRNGKATGVRVNGEQIGADRVICNADSTQAYQSLIKEVRPDRKYLTQQPSTSALIFYWGVKGKHPVLDLHNILFSANYQAEFDYLERKEVYHDPTVYIYISARIATDDAPEGCENWFVMINAPENTGQDWGEIRARARESICRKIKGMLNIDISPLILFEDYLDPVRIEDRTRSYRGALYGISSNSRMAAFHRHPNRIRKIDRLYFAGGSVHPGGGIPLCLASARIVDSYFKPV